VWLNQKERIRVDDSATDADGVSLWPVYESVFGDYSTFDAWCEAVWPNTVSVKGSASRGPSTAMP